MEEKLKQVVGVLLLCTLIFILWMFFGGPFDTYYLLWNLFLAWIPLGMALLLIRERKKEPSGPRSLLKGLWAALWLFFFPNAVYVITDFIHLSQDVFYYPNPSYEPYSGAERILYSMEKLPWNNFFSISYAVFLGGALSALSLYLLHRELRRTKGNLKAWGMVVAVHLLSGYAIYLGRFIRFNSWDAVLRPVHLLRFVVGSFDKQALSFSLQFFLLSLFIYLMFYLFADLGNSEGKAK